MVRKIQKASYSIEAAIYTPVVLFVLFHSLSIGIDFWQESRLRNINEQLKGLDIVQEFYMYQVTDEVVGEIMDEK